MTDSINGSANKSAAAIPKKALCACREPELALEQAGIRAQSPFHRAVQDGKPLCVGSALERGWSVPARHW